MSPPQPTLPSRGKNFLLKMPRKHSVTPAPNLFAISPNGSLFPQNSGSQGSVSLRLCFWLREELAGIWAEEVKKEAQTGARRESALGRHPHQPQQDPERQAQSQSLFLLPRTTIHPVTHKPAAYGRGPEHPPSTPSKPRQSPIPHLLVPPESSTAHAHTHKHMHPLTCGSSDKHLGTHLGAPSPSSTF